MSIIGGMEIDFIPGQTYRDEGADPGSRAEARQAMISEFRRAAQKTCMGQMNQVMDHLLGLIVQFRAVEGSAPILGKRMREMADFLEDL